jgi:MoxR-like ATPase
MPETSKKSDQPERRNEATNWKLVEEVLRSPGVRTAYLHGPPGIGKTYCAFHCGRIDAGVFAVTLTEETPASELRGHYVPKGRELVWQDGPFVAAMRSGARLVVNELTHGSPDAFSFLLPILESIETAQLTLPTNETVRPAPGFHVVATDNAPPDELPFALQDRFDCILDISEPHPAALERLRAPLRRIATRSFALEPERRISLRGWLALQRLEGEMGLGEACSAVFGIERGAQVHDAIVLAQSEG